MSPVHPKSKEEVVQEFRIQTIQDATMRVIARRGIAAATMQDIADEAGVAKGTIYLYFKDRDELVEKTFESSTTELHRRIDERISGMDRFEDQMRAAVSTLLEFFRDNGEFFRLYLAHRVPEDGQHQRNCDQYRTQIDKLAALMQAGIDRGEIRRIDTHRAALFIIEGINSIVMERVMEKAPASIEADVDLVTGLIFDGIRTQRSEG